MQNSPQPMIKKTIEKEQDSAGKSFGSSPSKTPSKTAKHKFNSNASHLKQTIASKVRGGEHFEIKQTQLKETLVKEKPKRPKTAIKF